jgi:hypothetical protein
MKVSLVINCDTRAQNDSFGGVNLTGVVNRDFLIDGVINKMKFFAGFELETIVHIDKHHGISDDDLSKLHDFCDTLLIRKHTEEYAFNDWNFHRALSLASGDIICHVDQDTVCFASSQEYVEDLLKHLDNYKLVSYPSHWTPNPTVDDSFGGMWWASTRFFICKRESLKLGELAKCIEDPEWMYEKYGDSPRRCNWTEHYLAKINSNNVFYPPVELHRGAIFSWSSYKTGTLQMLNSAPYEAVKQWLLHRGGIQYPCDVKCD